MFEEALNPNHCEEKIQSQCTPTNTYNHNSILNTGNSKNCSSLKENNILNVLPNKPVEKKASENQTIDNKPIANTEDQLPTFCPNQYSHVSGNWSQSNKVEIFKGNNFKNNFLNPQLEDEKIWENVNINAGQSALAPNPNLEQAL